jgi:hypothetical protein
MPEKPGLLLRVTLECAMIGFSVSDDTNDREIHLPPWRLSACKPCCKKPTASKRI